jgi:drug/metabolite transporter (DMT)-like permease
MLGNAVFFLLSERTSDSLSPVVLLGSGLTVAAATAWVLGLTGLLPLRFGESTTSLAEHHIPAGLSLTSLVVISTVVAYVCSVAGAARIGSTLMSLILLSEVLFAVVLSWLLLDESVSPLQLIGGVLVVGGIALARSGAEHRIPAPVVDAAGSAAT